FFTVHITSGTTSATAGTSPVDNTATVTTSNDGSDSDSDSIDVRAAGIDVAKTADDPSVSAGDPIGFTITVTNPGPGTACAATVADSPVDNTAHVSTSNDGSADDTASVTVLGTQIAIEKTADDPSVSAGDPIGFTIKVTNPGPGNAYNVTVNDPLPSDAGTSF